MLQKSQKSLVIDSSALIALERGGIPDNLKYPDFEIHIADAAFSEIGINKLKNMKNIKAEKLRGKSNKKAKDLIDKGLLAINILGFSFTLHALAKKGYIKNIWKIFDKIIEKCNWKNSEVEVSNYAFLKEKGY